jgi:SSS family solute:Na+ symporter
MFVATLVTTWYGNLLGVTEMAYKEGLVQWLTQGIFWYAAYVFFAFFIAKKIRESKLFTLPDQLEKFYDRKTAILGALINLIMLSPAAYILSMGLIFEIIFQIPLSQGLIIGSIITFIYTFRGGFKAVVVTDMLQFFFMFLGLALIIPFAINKFSLTQLLANIPNSHLSLMGSYSWQIVLAWLVIASWTLIDSNFYQRCYSARDYKTAQRGILIATAFWFVFDFMVCLVGLFAFSAMPNLEPATALVGFANSVLPPIAKGVFFTGLLATVMSTLDSLSFSSAMCFTKDIYQRIFKVTDTKKVIFVNKITIAVVALLGIIVAINFQSLIKLMYYKASIGISGLLLPLLCGFFLKKKLNANSAFFSIIAGSSACIIWLILQKLYIISINFEAIFVGLLASSITMFAIEFQQKRDYNKNR